MAPTSSLTCLSCRISYQSPRSLNALPSFSEKVLFFIDFCFAAPFQLMWKHFRCQWYFLVGSEIASVALLKGCSPGLLTYLDERNWAIVIAESLARVIAAIRMASVPWRFISSPKTQKLVLTDPAFVVLRFESRDWRSLVQHSFHVEQHDGLRELTAFVER